MNNELIKSVVNIINNMSTDKLEQPEEKYPNIQSNIYEYNCYGIDIEIKQDGTLWCTGFELTEDVIGGEKYGMGYYFNNEQIGTDADWRMVVGSECEIYAIKQDGTLWGIGEITFENCQNRKNYREFTQIGTDADWGSIEYDFDFIKLIKTNGDIYFCGKAVITSNIITNIKNVEMREYD